MTQEGLNSSGNRCEAIASEESFPDSSHDHLHLPPLCLPLRSTRCLVEGFTLFIYSETICNFIMKRFFKLTGTPVPRPSSPKPKPQPPPTGPAHPGPLSNTIGLEPKYTVPPVPHPNPYHHLDILVSRNGLLLRPHIPGYGRSESYVRIYWGLAGKVELVEDTVAKDSELDWSKAAVVYGVLGTLDLFTGM